MAGWAHWLSTVLAQDHFYSDFLSLLLTKQIHFESVMMIAFARHSLSVLTSVKLMIECVVQLLSRFPLFQVTHILHASTIAQHLEAKLLALLSWRLWERATSEQLIVLWLRPLCAASLAHLTILLFDRQHEI